METAGSPAFLGNPDCALALLFDPGGTNGIRPVRRPGAAPTASTAEAPAGIAFEAQSHGFGTGCLRFAGRVTPTPRKTRFRLSARLFRAGLITRRVPPKGFTMYPTCDPPFPSSTQRKDAALFLFAAARARGDKELRPLFKSHVPFSSPPRWRSLSKHGLRRRCLSPFATEHGGPAAEKGTGTVAATLFPTPQRLAPRSQSPFSAHPAQ